MEVDEKEQQREGKTATERGGRERREDDLQEGEMRGNKRTKEEEEVKEATTNARQEMEEEKEDNIRKKIRKIEKDEGEIADDTKQRKIVKDQAKDENEDGTNDSENDTVHQANGKNKHSDTPGTKNTNTNVPTNTTQKQNTHTNTPEAPTTTSNTTVTQISKRQLKRQERHARWLEGKEERRRRQREKEKVKRAMGAAPAGPSRKALKHVRMATSTCRLRLAVDMSLEALMDDRRLGQCLRQVGRCYSANRRAPKPLQLYVTSLQGRCETLMSQQAGYTNWDVHFRSGHLLDEFEKQDIVYLTSESPHVLTKLDEEKVYVIGGLVDYNKLKGHCLGVAEGLGLATAQLPLGKFLEMRTRKVLTIDQVFRVMLGVSGGAGWKEALLDALPPRKGAVGKEDEDEEEEEEEEGQGSKDTNAETTEEKKEDMNEEGEEGKDLNGKKEEEEKEEEEDTREETKGRDEIRSRINMGEENVVVREMEREEKEENIEREIKEEKERELKD